jgi:hypothetical protein
MSTHHRYDVAALSKNPLGIRAHSQSAKTNVAPEHLQQHHEMQVNPLWMITVALAACLLLIALAMAS